MLVQQSGEVKLVLHPNMGLRSKRKVMCSWRNVSTNWCWIS